jgi:hypothetical protein
MKQKEIYQKKENIKAIEERNSEMEKTSFD